MKHTNFNRLLTAALLLCFIVVLLAGCTQGEISNKETEPGSTKSTEQDKITLRVAVEDMFYSDMQEQQRNFSLAHGNVEIVSNAPVAGISSSYPGTPLRRGATGPSVVVIQTELNRISQSYPAIPKITPVDGIFGARTEAAVRKFQQVFNLQVDGIVGKATWYALVRYYIAVTSMAELRSQGQKFYQNSWAVTDPIEPGDRGIKVEHLQYMLRVLSEYIPEIPPIAVDGIFGPATENAVRAAQQRFGLPRTGVVDFDTWDEIYDQFSGIEAATWADPQDFPYTAAIIGSTNPRARYSGTSTMTQFPGNDLRTGNQDPVRQEAPR